MCGRNSYPAEPVTCSLEEQPSMHLPTLHHLSLLARFKPFSVHLLVPAPVEHPGQPRVDLLGAPGDPVVHAEVVRHHIRQLVQDVLEVGDLPAGADDGGLVHLLHPLYGLVALCGPVCPCAGVDIRLAGAEV